MLKIPKRHSLIATGGPEEPWITRDAISILDKIIKPSWKIAEWGMGSSTIWLARRCSLLISIDHNPVWFDEVTAEINRLCLEDKKIAKCKLDLRLETNVEKYVTVLNSFSEKTFDLILVDGRNRERCIQNAYLRIKKNRCIVLDNSERYNVPELNDWEKNVTSNPYWDTTFWKRT